MLVRHQHGVVGRGQLLAAGLSSRSVERRLANGRLHRLYAGVYAVGRPQIGRLGRLMAAVLACGSGARLSHRSAAGLWRVLADPSGPIDVSVPARRCPRIEGIRVHRRRGPAEDDATLERAIAVTTIVRTLLDLAAMGISESLLERAVNEADRLDLCDPEGLRAALDGCAGQPGVGRLRSLLDRRTFTLTDSELERAFLRIARAAGLPPPLTQQRVNGYRVDFLWPDLGLVVETDGLRYHRTPSVQARDRLRDQAHAAAGMTPLRFTHAQVRFDAEHVRATLAAVVRRLTSGG